MSTSMGQTGTGASQAKSGGAHEQMSGQGQNKQTQSASHSEGPIARTIEQQTAKLPSDTLGGHRFDRRVSAAAHDGQEKCQFVCR